MLSPVDADRARVAELAAEITMLELSLLALRDEQMRAQARLDAVKYPVLTLPNEIVSDIFIHFLPVYPLCPPFVGILSPTILTHICRRWRDIALTTPDLWRAMSFLGRKAIVVRDLQISNIWLKRSRNRPLSIIIHDRCWSISEIFAVLVPHRSRWEHIKFHAGTFNLPKIIGPMPILRHLDLCVDNLATRNAPVEIVDVLQLRTVVLNGFAIPNVALPYAQLTGLTLILVDQDVYRPILRQTPNLRHVELKILFRRNTASHDPGHELTLPCLESLTMNEPDYYAMATRIPDIFIVPALRRLQIEETFLGKDPVDALKSFIKTAGCVLQRVHITAIRNLLPRESLRDAFSTVKFSFEDWQDSDSGSEQSGASDEESTSFDV
ncbi:hypothetical protein DFH06DRAFT_571932 [Mycena polygramma]|nr:hypothetical protein DFH06DRAFT_571932 [Mycena polygramma]